MDSSSKYRQSGKPSTMKISFKRGIECFFDVDDFTIRVWGSAWTGRELVELDGQTVSSKLSLRRSTPHEFNYRGHQYKVIFSIVEFKSGLFEVQLYRDGKLIDSDQGRHASIPVNTETGEVDWRRYRWQLALQALLGGVVGGIFGYLAAGFFGGGG